MRAIASATGSIATAMWNALAWISCCGRARWRHGPSRTPDRRAAGRRGSTGLPSARSCMSLSRGQAMPQARQRDLHQAGAVDAEARLAAPQIRHADEALGDRDEIGLVGVERREMPCRHVAAGRSDGEAVLARAPPRRLRAERQRLDRRQLDRRAGKHQRAQRGDLVGRLRPAARAAQRPAASRHSRRTRAGPRPSLPRRSRRR